MVEFKIKTIAEQDTSIDQGNPDLYDGGSGYITVGDKAEPKLGLFRFEVAAKPNYGDAVLKHGQMGFYNLSTSSYSGTSLPQFSIYKMKTSPDGIDWGAGGSINPVKRGKVITGASASSTATINESAAARTNIIVDGNAGTIEVGDTITGTGIPAGVTVHTVTDQNNLVMSESLNLANDLDLIFTGTTDDSITVEDHQIKTGEPITWTPFVRFYGDSVLTGITREVEYFAIRVDTTTLKFASTVDDAMAGTAVNITTATPVTFTNTNVKPNINESRYGYLRSRKFRSDIHVVTSWGENYESIVEDFNGSPVRETELGFESIQRQVMRKDEQHITGGDYKSYVYKGKTDGLTTASDAWYNGNYGVKQSDGTYHIYLQSHKTNADGSGWWRTTGSNEWKFVKKHGSNGEPNPKVKYEGEIITGTERYGDEVTPANSIFHTVRGAREFQQAAETEDGKNDLQATGAIRFSSEKKLTGGQSCNLYSYWKQDAIGVAYTSADGKMTEKFNALNKGQETMVQYKNLPCPSPTMNTTLPSDFYYALGSGQLPLASGDTETTWDGHTSTIKITMNLAKLAKAFTVPRTSGRTPVIIDDIILSRRAMFVCLSETPVGKGETLYQYITRLGGRGTDDSGAALTNWADNAHITANTTGNLSAVGFWIVNTSLGIQVLPLCNQKIKSATLGDNFNSYIDSDNQEFYAKGIYNSKANTSEKNSHLTSIGTDVVEDEWVDWHIRIPNQWSDPVLHIVSNDGMELAPSSGDDTSESDAKNGIPLFNIKQDRLVIPTANVEVSVANTITSTGHGYADGDSVLYYNGGGTTMAGLTSGRGYFIKVTDANNFRLTSDNNGDTVMTITGTGNNDQMFIKNDVGRMGHDPSTWTKNLSIWTCNSQSAFSVNSSGNPDDYIHGEEDADMEHNIFIDAISMNGINVAHQNNTKVPDESLHGHSAISITSSNIQNATYYGEPAYTNWHPTAAGSMSQIGRVSDTCISLGFEDPSQISSHHQAKKSWRYLYWQGYTSSNLGSDGPIAWSADHTLPADTYLDTTSTYTERDWFSAVDQHGSSKVRYDEVNSEVWYHDAGAPFTYSPIWSVTLDSGNSSPAWTTSYSDAHVSLGAQFSQEALNHRNLYYNRTTAATTNDRAGGAGAGQRMFTTMPSMGILFRGQSDVDAGTDVITINKGSFGATEHNWNAGHKVVYFNNGKDDVGVLSSCDNTFKDTPTVYYIDYVSATTFKLTASYDHAIEGTDALDLTVSTTDDGLHALYDYDYYVNGKYWMNGWESKGFSRLILQPTLNDTSAIIKANYTDNKGNGSYPTDDPADTDVETDETTFYLTKRENIQCSAKVLEVAKQVGNPVYTGSYISAGGSITLKVDTIDPLVSVPGTKYRAYLIAKGTITAGDDEEGGYNLGEADTTNYKSGLTVSFIDSNTIKIENWDGYSSTGTTDLISDDNISSLWIGPEKYWVYFKISNRTGDTIDTHRSLPNKSFNNVCVVSPYGGGNATDVAAGNDTAEGFWADNDAWGTPGATYNESTANFEKIAGVPSAYINKWSPEPSTVKTETIFDLQDYGFGSAEKAKEGDNDAFGGVRGGNVSSFVPRDNQINLVNMFNVFSSGEAKKPGDYLDLALTAEDLAVDSTLLISSSDNASLPKPFLLTVYEDAKPANPTNFKVSPDKKDAFLPEFTWSASDADLWYGFIIIDDVPIENQYHGSILHVPLDEDLRSYASKYDNDKGNYYESASDPVIYGYRYYNTTVLDSNRRPLDETDASVWATNFALKSGGTEKTTASGVKIYDSLEGLAGNTKYFDKDGGSYIEFPFSTASTTGAALSASTYPRDEMSVVVHITPSSWADSGERAYIASFNESTDTTAAFDAWGMYLDDAGLINAFVAAQPGDTTPSTWIQLKSTTKVPINGVPTSIILTVDTQSHHGNVKLFINGRLEDQTGLRKTTVTSNNWPTHSTGIGGEAIHFDTNSTTAGLFIGAKAQNGSQVGQSTFNGKIEEFVWYDKIIYPIIPQNSKYTLEKPLEELVSGSENSSSKSHTARLFVKDYHNIRGKTTGEVAASSQVSFKKAAFELYT